MKKIVWLAAIGLMVSGCQTAESWSGIADDAIFFYHEKSGLCFVGSGRTAVNVPCTDKVLALCSNYKGGEVTH